MKTKHIPASEVKSGDVIVFARRTNGYLTGTVEKIYNMVDNQLQFRFLKGGIYTAITYNSSDYVTVAA